MKITTIPRTTEVRISDLVPDKALLRPVSFRNTYSMGWGTLKQFYASPTSKNARATPKFYPELWDHIYTRIRSQRAKWLFVFYVMYFICVYYWYLSRIGNYPLLSVTAWRLYEVAIWRKRSDNSASLLLSPISKSILGWQGSLYESSKSSKHFRGDSAWSTNTTVSPVKMSLLQSQVATASVLYDVNSPSQITWNIFTPARYINTALSVR